MNQKREGNILRLTSICRVYLTSENILSPGLHASATRLSTTSSLVKNLGSKIHVDRFLSWSDEGADPDAQDTYGNTVLHMVVIVEQLGRKIFRVFYLY